MRSCVGIVLLACGVLSASGCATYRAYPGPRRATAEIAVVMVSVDGLRVDGEVTASNVNKVELAPGAHELQWSYRYSNGYVEAMVLDFAAVAGQRYRLGQRFFAQPHPDGPIGAIVEFTVETTLIPIKMFVPPEAPEGPPEGEYYSWVVATRSGRVVGGLAPDVPMEHPPITFVPLDQADP
jgi:hypothetical protein